MTKKELLKGILEKVLYDKDVVSTILQNAPIQKMDYNFPSFSMEKKTNASGKEMISYSIVVNGVEIKEGHALKFGQGSYGQVYYDNVENVLYKVVSYTAKVGQKPESIRQNFINIIYEVAIQAILSKLTYVNHENKKAFIAPALYGFYKYDTGQKNDFSYVIAMEKAGVTADDTLVINNFRHTLQDYAIILDTLLNTYNIKYNHCDTKLNNLIFDKNNCLQLIDFGFSSLKVLFEDKSILQIENPNCGWHMDDKNGILINMGQNKENPGYYIQKDLIQLLFTTKAHYYKFMNDGAKKFVDNMLYYIGLMSGNKIADIYNVTQPDFGKRLFKNAYNFYGDLRTRFRNQPMILEKSMPSDLGKQLQNMGFPQKVMPSAPPSFNNTNDASKFGNSFSAPPFPKELVQPKIIESSNSNSFGSSFGNSFSVPPIPSNLLPKVNDPNEMYRKVRKAITDDDVEDFKKLVEKPFDVEYKPFSSVQSLLTSCLINILESSYPYASVLVEKGGNIYAAFDHYFAIIYDAERFKMVIQKVIEQKVPIDFYKPMMEGELSIYETIKERSKYGLEKEKEIYKTILPIVKTAQPKPGFWGKMKGLFGRGGRSTRRGRGGRKNRTYKHRK